MKNRALIFTATALMVLLILAGCDSNSTNSFIPNYVTLIVGTAYTSLSIEAFGTNFYQFTPGSTGIHTIRLTNNLTSDMSWTLYTNPDILQPNIIDSQDAIFGIGDEIGTTPSLSAGAVYYIAVDEWDSVAGTFDLQITFP